MNSIIQELIEKTQATSQISFQGESVTLSTPSLDDIAEKLQDLLAEDPNCLIEIDESDLAMITHEKCVEVKIVEVDNWADQNQLIEKLNQAFADLQPANILYCAVESTNDIALDELTAVSDALIAKMPEDSTILLNSKTINDSQYRLKVLVLLGR